MLYKRGSQNIQTFAFSLVARILIKPGWAQNSVRPLPTQPSELRRAPRNKVSFCMVSQVMIQVSVTEAANCRPRHRLELD